MYIYFPVAGTAVDVLFVLSLGGVAGFLSGMFGLSGGFVVTPILIFMGIPVPVALASSASQGVASSFSGVLSNWNRGSIDLHMGSICSVGSMCGAYLGVKIFNILDSKGIAEFVVAVIYVFVLGGIALVILNESIRAIVAKKNNVDIVRSERYFLVFASKLPLKMKFSNIEHPCSVLVPIFIGLFVGLMVSLTGVGGGFIFVPAMIYLLGMPTMTAIGTSAYQVLVVTAFVTFVYSTTMYSVDILLSSMLMIGSVIGVQIGMKVSNKLPAEELRMLLALLIIVIVIKLVLGVVVTPDNVYSVRVVN